jgi:hypothetical protein
MCEVARQLLHDANQAALEFSKALAALLGEERAMSRKGSYGSLRHAVQLARKRSELASQAAEEHFLEHDCELMFATAPDQTPTLHTAGLRG